MRSPFTSKQAIVLLLMMAPSIALAGGAAAPPIIPTFNTATPYIVRQPTYQPLPGLGSYKMPKGPVLGGSGELLTGVCEFHSPTPYEKKLNRNAKPRGASLNFFFEGLKDNPKLDANTKAVLEGVYRSALSETVKSFDNYGRPPTTINESDTGNSDTSMINAYNKFSLSCNDFADQVKPGGALRQMGHGCEWEGDDDQTFTGLMKKQGDETRNYMLFHANVVEQANKALKAHQSDDPNDPLTSTLKDVIAWSKDDIKSCPKALWALSQKTEAAKIACEQNGSRMEVNCIPKPWNKAGDKTKCAQYSAAVQSKYSELLEALNVGSGADVTTSAANATATTANAPITNEASSYALKYIPGASVEDAGLPSTATP